MALPITVEPFLLSEPCNQVNLLLTDVIMPKMNGQTLAHEMIKRQPDLRVIFTSGYSENVIVTNGILENGIEFLQKPVSEKQLLRKIRSVLDKRP